MSGRPPTVPTPVPWADRGDASGGAPAASPRSQRDLEILRSLARRINPQDAGAHNNLGVVYYNKGLYDEAVRHFERALELDPRMQVAERNLQIAYFGTGHFERLITNLRRRLEANAADEEARDELARTYYNSGDLNGAIEELRRLLTVRPRDASLYQRLARAELKLGNLDNAIVALRNAETLDPQNARVQFLLGEVQYQRGLSEDARGPLERAVSLDPTLADAFHLLAFVYGDLGENERANQMSARAAELNPSYAKAEAGLSLDSYSTARYQELIGDRAAPKAIPGVAEGGELAHYNLGLAFRQKALYEEALREFRLATERGEDTFLVQQAQAEMLLLRGDSEEAARLYGGLIEQESASPKLWNELGVARHQLGDLEAADQAYQRALEIDPNYALAWNNLGVVRHHRSAGDAESAFRSALKEGRAPGDVWRNYALMLHREGRRDDSATAYERALEMSSTAHAHTGYGMLLMEMGRAEDARTELLRAVELDPDMPEARYHLAFALSALGDYQGALRETKLALELNPYIPTPRFRLLIDLQFEEASLLAPELDAAERVAGDEGVASFNFQPGSLDAVFSAGVARASAAASVVSPGEESLIAAREALERGLLDIAGTEAQRALMFGASRMEVLLLQGDIFLRRGFAGEAVERFNEALAAIDPAADNDDALRRALQGAARSLIELGRMTEAVEAAERLCELAGDDVPALMTLGDALMRVEDFARAAMVFEQARMSAPNDVHLLTQLGAAYAAAGDPEGAESALRRAITNDARAATARTVLARVLVDEGREDEADAEFREALNVLPSYGEAAFGLAELEEKRGRVREAMHLMVDLLTMDPYRLDALKRLGDLLVIGGMGEQARYAYERVLRFDPKDVAARAALTQLEAAQA